MWFQVENTQHGLMQALAPALCTDHNAPPLPPHPPLLAPRAIPAPSAVGGAFAFIKKGSTKSLMSAGGSALILALAGRSMVGATAKSSVFVALAVAVLLTVVMAGRFQRTGKVMPAGMMAGSSLAMSIAYLATAF